MNAEREVEEVMPGSEASSRRKRTKRAPDTHVANALRTAYEETVRENIPAEFLDLLGKLD